MTNIPENLERIFWYASLAPSPHNCQPWKVKVLSGTGGGGANLEFMVQSDSSRWLPHCDPLNRELLISIGAFWENLEQAASAFEFEIHTEIAAAKTTDTDLLKVKLVKCPQSKNNHHSSALLSLMESRFTNHRKYKRNTILPSHLEECQSLLSDSLTYFPRESEKGKWIVSNQIKAMHQQVFNDGKQREMAEWMRFSRSLAVERGDGITAEMAGFSGIAKFLWYAFMTPQHVLSKNIRDNTVKWIKHRVTWCAGFFVITSEDNSVSSLLYAGRAFEQLALKCTQLNIQVSPIAQLINEVPWNQRLSVELGLSKPVQMMMIVGYSDQTPKLLRIRRPVEDFVIHQA